jgi:hypothetical protein
VQNESVLTADKQPANLTIHLRVPPADLRRIRSLVPQRYVDLPEALRAMIRVGLTVELGGSGNG